MNDEQKVGNACALFLSKLIKEQKLDGNMVLSTYLQVGISNCLVNCGEESTRDFLESVLKAYIGTLERHGEFLQKYSSENPDKPFISIDHKTGELL